MQNAPFEDSDIAVFFCLIFISNLVFIPSFFFLQEEAEIPIHFYQKISVAKNIQEFINIRVGLATFWLSEPNSCYGNMFVSSMNEIHQVWLHLDKLS